MLSRKSHFLPLSRQPVSQFRLDNINTLPCTMHRQSVLCVVSTTSGERDTSHLYFFYCRPHVTGLPFPSFYAICSYPISGTQVWLGAFILLLLAVGELFPNIVWIRDEK